MNNTLFHDRENDLSISNYTVQLFTVPTIAEFLVTHTKIISSIFFILKGFFLGDSVPENFRPQSDLLKCYKSASSTTNSIFPRMACESAVVRNKKYWHLFQDVSYILSNEIVKKELFRKYPEHLKDFLDLLVIFQGMQPQQRSTQVHVEYETDHWVHALNLALQLSMIGTKVADCFGVSHNPVNDFSNLVEAIKKTVFFLCTWCSIDHVKETVQFKNQSKHQESNFEHPFGFNQVQYGNETHYLPDFKVSIQRVSLYDPLHCLLAELLSKIPIIIEGESDTKAVDQIWNMIFSEEAIKGFHIVDNLSSYSPHVESIKKKHLLTLLFDYPMRIIVMLSQIRAGIWVRNGYMMHSQAQHFREVMLREWYDNNLFLVQTAAAVLPPSLFLASLVERFELRNWLTFGKPGKIDLAQQASINEDLLQVLIYSLSERSRILGISHADELKREITHHLGSSTGLAYSELKKRITDSLLETSQELEAFDLILRDVSTFKFPENSLDQGIYLLKDEYFANLDPWFWHLSRPERNFLEAALKKRADTAMKTGKSEFRLPTLLKLSPSCFHREILAVFNDQNFFQIIFYSIWHSTKRIEDCGEEATPGDHVLNASIHLILLGISESKMSPITTSLDSFYRNFSSVQFKIQLAEMERSISLLELICSLVDRANEEDIKEHASSLRYIISQVELYGVESAVQTILGWRDKSRWNFTKTKQDGETLLTENDSLSAKERKKIASKKRQAAIMAQFESAQKSFMANYGEELSHLEDDSLMESSFEKFSTPPEQRLDQRITSFPSGSCIVCQEDASPSDGRTYGSLGLFQASLLHRTFQFPGNDKFLQILSKNAGKWDLTSSTLQSYEKNMGIYSSSCGHLMHSSCFNTYLQSIESRQMSQSTRNHPEDINRREFLCPLCKTFGNALFPITTSSYVEFANWFGSEDISETNAQKYHEVNELSLDKWWLSNCQKLQDIITSQVVINPSIITMETNNVRSSQGIVESTISNFKNYINRVLGGSSVGANPWSYSEELQRTFDENWIPALENACEELDLALSEPNFLLSYTISCIEISSRGLKPENQNCGGVCVDVVNCLNPQVAAFLPVFVSTLHSYSRLCLQESDFCSVLNCESVSLFASIFHGILKNINTVSVPGVLVRDSFQVLSQIFQTMDLLPEGSLSDIFCWIRICWLIEISKTFSSLLLNRTFYTKNAEKGFEDTILADIYSSLNIPHSDRVEDLDELIEICEAIGLIFLRRTALLCFAFFGMVPPTGKHGFGFEFDTQEYNTKSSTESRELQSYLLLPSVRQLLLEPKNDSSIERLLIRSWINNSKDELQWTLSPVPIQYKLVELPSTYDDLFDVSRKYTCPNCNQKPSDPALCLICGEIVCSQSYCCLKDGLGECNQHARKYFSFL